MTESMRARTHIELAHSFLEMHASNISDELHDRSLDDLADAYDENALIPLLNAIHDSRYARMTLKFDDTIPMTDDDAFELAFDLNDECDDADCCNDTIAICDAILTAAAYSDTHDNDDQ